MPKDKQNKINEKTKVVKKLRRRLYTNSDTKVGAPSKFDLFNKEIIERARKGSTKRDRVGGLIHDSTYCDWISAGDEDLKNGIDSQYSEFSKKIREAEEEFRNTLRISIKSHSLNDWKAAAWLLERSDPDSYKLKDKMEVKQEIEISQKAILEIPENGRRIKTET